MLELNQFHQSCCFFDRDLFICHDVLNLFSDLFSDNNQNLSFFSEFIFNSHYMFRRSGPDHMLLHTVLKQKGARLNFTFTCESKSKIQDKQKFTKILSWKKLIPSGATQLPPQLSLSSTVLMAPPCRDSLLLCRHFTPSNDQGRTGSAHMRAPGSTPGVEDGDGRQRNEDPP